MRLHSPTCYDPVSTSIALLREAFVQGFAVGGGICPRHLAHHLAVHHRAERAALFQQTGRHCVPGRPEDHIVHDARSTLAAKALAWTTSALEPFRLTLEWNVSEDIRPLD